MMLHKNIHRGCLFLVISIMLGGCYGYKEVSYFKPVPHENIRVEYTLRLLPEVVQIPLSETVELTLFIRDEPQHSRLLMHFYLPAGEMAQFESSNITVTPFGGGQIMVGTIETIEASYIAERQVRYLTTRDNLEGATYEYNKAFGRKGKVPRRFMTDVAFPIQLPDHFTLRMPTLKLSGKVIQMPEIEYQRQTGSAWQGRELM